MDGLSGPRGHSGLNEGANGAGRTGSEGKMGRVKSFFIICLLVLCGGSGALGSTVIDGWALKIDGQYIPFTDFAAATGASLEGAANLIPGVSVDASGISLGSIDVSGGGGQTGGGTGLGTLSVVISGSGTHTVTLWLDTHIEAGDPFVYWNDYGTVAGSPTGYPWTLSYTIDQPGYDNTSGYIGTAAAQARAGVLDNTNHLPLGGAYSPNDVSLALSMTYTAQPGYQYTIYRFDIGYTVDDFNLGPGFYLLQNGADGGGTLYIDGFAGVPEPSAWVLMLGGLFVIAAMKYWRRAAAKAR